jgi:iron complex outermembrane receptor protein
VPSVVFDPADKSDELVTAFVQDSYDAVPGRLRVVLGTRFERNDYTGVELQPSARLLWRAAPRHSLWAAVTRAVRTPSRVERDLSLTLALSPGTPAFARVVGGDRFTTEKALSVEAGYRAQPGESLVVDMAVFHTRYPNLLSLEPGAPLVEDGFPIVPFLIANGLRGRVSGIETAVDVRPAEWLVVRAGHDYLNMALEPASGSADTTSSAAEDASPRHRLHLRATLRSPGRPLSLDARWRRVARLPAQDVPAYSELDLRLAWQPRERLELAVAGRNLLHSHHAEFGSLTRVERSVFAEATWAW